MRLVALTKQLKRSFHGDRRARLDTSRRNESWHELGQLIWLAEVQSLACLAVQLVAHLAFEFGVVSTTVSHS